jgi:hypothetical protein
MSPPDKNQGMNTLKDSSSKIAQDFEKEYKEETNAEELGKEKIQIRKKFYDNPDNSGFAPKETDDFLQIHLNDEPDKVKGSGTGSQKMIILETQTGQIL